MTSFEELPKECIVTILSRTTPIDVGRFSILSKTFRSTVDYDDVWNCFLPSDISSILSQCPSLANIQTKKALYLALSDRPIIIDHGQKSFQLDRKSGKKCYMLSARYLAIAWGDDRYCNWIVVPDSRFPEVAYLRRVWWLGIRWLINMLALSPNTQYAAYLVFKMNDAQGFHNCPLELSVGVGGSLSSTKIVCLDPNVEGRQQNRVARSQHPNVRSDGWLEIEIGEFFNSGLDDEVQMNVKETDYWKKGLFVEGIEFRLK